MCARRPPTCSGRIAAAASVGAACVAMLGVTGLTARAQTPNRRVDIVATAGCLREQAAGTWMLVDATEPVKSVANAPQKTELPNGPVSGTLQFQLIGVGEFNLPALKGQLVYVKGLHIVATATSPVSRLNVTSVTPIAATCPSKAGGTVR